LEISFRSLKHSDLPTVKAIYDWYIENSTSTFHTEPISEEQLLEFIYINHPLYKSFMILVEEEVSGYCLLTNHKKRPAYDRTAEVTIYLKHDRVGKGIGCKALDYLEVTATELGVKNLIGVITGDNKSSIKLFQRYGYHKCAHFKNVGEKFGRVLDVVAFQKEI
jgi:phosphinothricin acetyltransferase